MYKERKLLVAERGNLFACLLYYPIVIWDIFGLTKALKIHNLLDDFFSSELKRGARRRDTTTAHNKNVENCECV